MWTKIKYFTNFASDKKQAIYILEENSEVATFAMSLSMQIW